ncbi:MAG: FAD-binding protein [Bacteroidota bacterium]|nr:FAD-binding protein [Bacteroidota bacterium]MDX5431809.1 FAD-binding protein [Bacteroidota bacterium]MDX5470520.1 FAD-binding protein [Bacteroidota bacterium]
MSKFNPISTLLPELENILDKEYILLDESQRIDYSKDYTEDLQYMPELVVLPGNVDEIASIVKLCQQYQVALTPRGAGTGLSGGALPAEGGIVLSLKRLNRILDIDTRNFQATVQPGVINQDFQDAVAELGLFYPPDPASKGSCFLGGNIAHNSGGPRALKYGVTKDYVLNLQVVTPKGEIIWTGANTLKNSTGYNLTQLMLGSEGTLGIITAIVFKLLPKPKHTLLMLAEFEDAEKACEAVGAVFHEGLNPSALEFMERSGVEISVNRLNTHFAFQEGIDAYLLIEVDGNVLDRMLEECEMINAVLENYQVKNVLFAESAEEKEHLWRIRRAIGETVKAVSTYKEEDTVVPRAELPALLRGVKEIGQRYGFQSVCYGHAGDGNLHVNILKGDLSNEAWNQGLKPGIREIFELCKKLGGTLSGEHGIGLVQKEFMDIIFPEHHLELMRAIKRAFDPAGILNPGKIIPDIRS